MLVIGIIGPKASGKDTSARYIAEKYQGCHHAHSEILAEILAILNLPISRENQINLVGLRKAFGPEVLTRALNKRIREDSVSLQVITGIRFDSELANIRSYPNNKIIYISAPIELRYQWQYQRGHKHDDAISFEEFQEIEKRETEVHIEELGRQADFHIENTGTEQELYSKIDGIMKQIFKGQ